MEDVIVLTAGWSDPQTANTTDTQYITNPLPHKIRLIKAYLMPADAAAANDTNYRTFTFVKGATSLITAVNTTVATGASLVAGTAVALSVLPAAGSSLELSPLCADNHAFVSTHTASGVAFSGHIVCMYQVVR